MKITKKINNNVALAEDKNGKSLVIFGKGVGFPTMPYELTDLSAIQRSFYDIRSNYIELAGELPEDMVMLAADIVEMAQYRLGCELNPNLPFTLADHLNFALERCRNGLEISLPLAYDVSHFYPKETELGRWALEEIQKRKGVELPPDEAVNIALHLVNGEMEQSDMHSTLAATEVIHSVTQIIEDTLHIRLDTTGFNYSRFVMHLRFLLQRIEDDAQEVNGMSSVMSQMCRQYLEVYHCTLKVQQYLADVCHRACGPDETLYLFMHINRLSQRDGGGQ